MFLHFPEQITHLEMNHGGNQNLLALLLILVMPSHPANSIPCFSQEEKEEVKDSGC